MDRVRRSAECINPSIQISRAMKATADVSSYYPPRARWYTRLFFIPAERARRRFHLDRLRLPGGISIGDFFVSLAFPGYAFWALNRRALGWMFGSGYVIAALLFVAALGYPASNIAYGTMISLHVTSIVFLEGLWLGDSPFRVRLGASLCTLVAVWSLVYAPAVGYAERHWLMPLRMGNRLFVVHRTQLTSIHRGDLVAYEVKDRNAFSNHEHRIILQSGLALDRALALPGDRVRFAGKQLFVNERPVAAPANLPAAGEFVVPEKTWFIWPQFAIQAHGVSVAEIQAAIQEAALVPADQIIGKPFRAWFGRRQSL